MARRRTGFRGHLRGMAGLSDYYYAIEEKYYVLMDYIERKGLHVYKYFVYPIEGRGIPSFPVAFLILVALVAGTYLGISALLAPAVPVAGNTTLTIAVTAAGAPVPGAEVTLQVRGAVPRTVTTDENGIAKFDNVPVGKAATIKVKKEGYLEFTQDTLTVARKVVKAQLTKLTPSQIPFTVYARDAGGKPLLGVVIHYIDPATNKPAKAVSDAYGIATIMLPREDIYLSLSATLPGYVNPPPMSVYGSQREVTFSFTSETNTTPDNGGTQEIKGTVFVKVQGKDGKAVDGALVELYNEDALSERIASRYADEQGTASFEDAIAVGMKVIAKATPTGAAAEDYSAASSTPKLVGKTTTIDVVLPRRVPELEKYLNLTIKLGGTNDTAYGAEVRLFLIDAPAAEKDHATTDDSGRTSFILAEGVKAYATAYYPNYFPLVITNHYGKGLEAGDKVEVFLEKILLGSYGEVRVEVVDVDGQPAANARVELFTQEGYFSGFPSVDADTDGVAVFPTIPLDAAFKARASLGTQVGESDIFKAYLGEAKTVKVVLKPATGVISVAAKDRTTGKSIKATVTALVGGRPAKAPDCVICSCETKLNQKSAGCALKVRANKEFVIKAEAAGYVAYESRGVFVPPNQETNLELSLLPAEMANNLTVRLEGFYDTRTWLKINDNTPLERGREYRVVLSVNIPSTAEDAGATLHVGDRLTLADEPAEFVAFAPQENVSWSSSYNPSPDCNSNFIDQYQGHAKFIAWNFSGWTGTREVTARLLVKPTATSQDAVLLYYNAWAQKGGVYVRVPNDPVLKEAKNTPLLDWCYAQAKQDKRSVTEGKAKCSANGEVCFSYAYETGAASITTGNAFKLTLDVRAFVSLNAPVIKISSPNKELSFRAYSLVSDGIPVQGTGNDASEITINLRDKITSDALQHSINGSIVVLPVIYSDAAKLEYSFDDSGGRGMLLKFDDYLKITGAGAMALVVTPTEIPITKAATLTASLFTTVEGVTKPITNARISVEEGSGNPFNGQVDLPSLKGDDSPGNGKDGVYKLKDIKPVFPGRIVVRAKRAGFMDVVSEVLATAITNEALAFESDVSAGVIFSGDECNRTKAIKITNQLNSRVTVTIAAGAPSCVSLRVGAATVKPGQIYSFPLSRSGTATIAVTPLAGLETCSVAFSVTLSDETQTDPMIVAFDTSECKPVYPPTMQLCKYDFGDISTPPGGCGEYASEGTCIKSDCTCPAGMTHCTPADDPSVADQCRIKTSKADYGYVGASCNSGKCSVGYCNCRDQLGNKYTIAMFEHLWFNYLLASMAQEQVEPVHYKGVSGGALIRFKADGSINWKESAVYPFGSSYDAVSSQKKTIKKLAVKGALFQEDSPSPAQSSFMIEVSPYMPYAGFAIVIDNSASDTERTLMVKDTFRDSGCFKIREIGKGFFNTLLTWDIFTWINELAKEASNTLSETWPPNKVAARDGRAFAVVFDPFSSKCKDVNITYKPCTNPDDKECGVKMNFTDKTQEKAYGFQLATGVEGVDASDLFPIRIKDRWFKYALAASPFLKGTAVARVEDAMEPFAFANNLMTSHEKAAVKIYKIDAKDKEIEIADIPPVGHWLAPKAGGVLKNVSVPVSSIKVKVGGVEVGGAEFKVNKPDNANNIPAALREYDVIGNANNASKAACSGTNFCYGNAVEEFKKDIEKEFNEGLEGTAAKGMRATVARSASRSAKVFSDAFLVALYKTGVGACSDAEVLECFGFKQPTKAWTTPASGFTIDQIMRMYMTLQYEAKGAPDFPGFLGTPDPECNFQVVLEFLCNAFFNPKGVIRSKRYEQRLPGVGLETFRQAFCVATTLRAAGAIGTGKAPVNPMSLTGPWDMRVSGDLSAVAASAAKEAYQRLYNIEGKGTQAYKGHDRGVEAPVMGEIAPEITVPYRKAGEDGGIKLAKFYGVAKGIFGIPVKAAEVEEVREEETSFEKIKGYPYLHCKEGGKNCIIEFSASPVLATLNKYHWDMKKNDLKVPTPSLMAPAPKITVKTGKVNWVFKQNSQNQQECNYTPEVQLKKHGPELVENGETCDKLNINITGESDLRGLVDDFESDDLVFTKKIVLSTRGGFLGLGGMRFLVAARPAAQLNLSLTDSSIKFVRTTNNEKIEEIARGVVEYFVNETAAPNFQNLGYSFEKLKDVSSVKQDAKNAVNAAKELSKAKAFVNYASNALPSSTSTDTVSTDTVSTDTVSTDTLKNVSIALDNALLHVKKAGEIIGATKASAIDAAINNVTSAKNAVAALKATNKAGDAKNEVSSALTAVSSALTAVSSALNVVVETANQKINETASMLLGNCFIYYESKDKLIVECAPQAQQPEKAEPKKVDKPEEDKNVGKWHHHCRTQGTPCDNNLKCLPHFSDGNHYCFKIKTIKQGGECWPIKGDTSECVGYPNVKCINTKCT